MTYSKLTFAVLFVLSFLFSNAGDISASQLVGSWKITDVKLTGSGATADETQHCYLCDLYHHDKSLVFTALGEVQYQDDANPNQVFYKINGNKLIFYRSQVAEIMTPEKSEVQNKTETTSVEFTVSLVNNVMTIQRKYPDYTETYTLTK